MSGWLLRSHKIYIYPIDFNCRIHSHTTHTHTHTQVTLSSSSSPSSSLPGFSYACASGSVQHAGRYNNAAHIHLHTQNWFWCFLGLLTCYILYGFRNLPLERINDTVNHIEVDRNTHAHTHSSLPSPNSTHRPTLKHAWRHNWNSHSAFVGQSKQTRAGRLNARAPHHTKRFV